MPPQEISIFPLNTVLFPGGLLPLKVFEQRYIDMTKACLRDGTPFGVCLIREGREVGDAAVPEPVGCLATIQEWEMPQLGVFHLVARGGERFRIRDMSVAPNQLVRATVEWIDPDPPVENIDPVCREVLQAVVEKVGAERFSAPLRLDDAAWIGFRLAEMLPIDPPVRQSLLELTDAAERLQRLHAVLVRQGIAAQ